MSQPQDKIEAKITCLIGHNRVGKTSIMRKLIQAYKRSKPKHHKVYTFDPQGKFQDLTSPNCKITDLEFEFMFEVRDALIVLDDYRMLLDAEKLDKNFWKLQSLRAENGLDIILSMHHPEMIHKKISYYVTDMYLFYTNLSDNTAECSRKLMNADVIIDIMQNINRHVAQHGKYGKNEGDFKFVIYKNQDILIDSVSHLGDTGRYLIEKVNTR